MKTKKRHKPMEMCFNYMWALDLIVLLKFKLARRFLIEF